MGAFRATLWMLIAIDLLTGLLMFISPALFGALTNFPVKDAPVMRGYGERIVLLALVYIWLVRHPNPTRAGWLIWIPSVDEWANTLADAYELLGRAMPIAVVGPMLATHAILASALTLATWQVAKAIAPEEATYTGRWGVDKNETRTAGYWAHPARALTGGAWRTQ